ncbi:MAG: crossover junction endodeoxyribonuclease RuvC [Actinobacteria bacterium]|nr:crossover junction endodeoxyribonuclease RuvC [Acidimicrobiia bacterium]MCA1734981.1 crossover junction endodeoxyribonuclease RuvC [Actinomycetota bacterium]
MFVLGIDPGLTTTGYGFVRRRRDLEAIAAGVIRTHPDSPLTTRLLEIHRRLAELIVEHRPDAIALEQVFTNRNLQTAIAVGRAAGVAILAAAQHELEVFEYPPTVIKAAVTGDGAADKRMVATMVGRRLGVAPPSPADAADALAVAICHLQSLRVVGAKQ